MPTIRLPSSLDQFRPRMVQLCDHMVVGKRLRDAISLTPRNCSADWLGLSDRSAVDQQKSLPQAPL